MLEHGGARAELYEIAQDEVEGALGAQVALSSSTPSALCRAAGMQSRALPHPSSTARHREAHAGALLGWLMLGSEALVARTVGLLLAQMWRLNPGRAVTGSRSHEQPQGGVALDSFSLALLHFLDCWGAGVHPGPLQEPRLWAALEQGLSPWGVLLLCTCDCWDPATGPHSIH